LATGGEGLPVPDGLLHELANEAALEVAPPDEGRGARCEGLSKHRRVHRWFLEVLGARVFVKRSRLFSKIGPPL
jgi:hypothetical protein